MKTDFCVCLPSSYPKCGVSSVVRRSSVTARWSHVVCILSGGMGIASLVVIVDGAASTELFSLFCEPCFMCMFDMCFLCAVCLCVFLVCTHAQGCLYE